ncbi:hypothetical protein DFH27DRAFT_656349 [Peziza echinospora]|nr:hypothetical protein DFH27DRAFT_656349 [Peziza echinospora]
MESKRGLIYIPSAKNPKDDDIWLSALNRNVSWYYNYQMSGAQKFSQSPLEFVPMLWGAKDNTQEVFVQNIKDQKKDTNIRYVLAFNEPDMTQKVGGSDMTPKKAAQVWKDSIEPLKTDGVLLGAPAIAGTEEGKKWLETFFRECTGCTIDFIPLHWYGDFPSLASHLGHMHEVYPNHTLWVTELGYPHKSLADTQTFYKMATNYLDALDYVERYAWFGSFRSDVSNVGANMAMLDSKGRLTDIGSWYLGGDNTGVKPSMAGPARGEGMGLLLLFALFLQLFMGLKGML